MKQTFLLPHRYKWIGLAAVVTGLLMFCPPYSMWEKLLAFDISRSKFLQWLVETDSFSGVKIDFTYTLQIFLVVGGGLLLMFSKEKIEDEFTASLRLRAVMLSVLISYIIVLLADIFLYGERFLYVMCYNFYVIIVLYSIIFHILLYGNSRKTEGMD